MRVYGFKNFMPEKYIIHRDLVNDLIDFLDIRLYLFLSVTQLTIFADDAIFFKQRF